jgi:hypothetical protein
MFFFNKLILFSYNISYGKISIAVSLNKNEQKVLHALWRKSILKIFRFTTEKEKTAKFSIMILLTVLFIIFYSSGQEGC